MPKIDKSYRRELSRDRERGARMKPRFFDDDFSDRDSRERLRNTESKKQVERALAEARGADWGSYL